MWHPNPSVGPGWLKMNIGRMVNTAEPRAASPMTTSAQDRVNGYTSAGTQYYRSWGQMNKSGGLHLIAGKQAANFFPCQECELCFPHPKVPLAIIDNKIWQEKAEGGELSAVDEITAQDCSSGKQLFDCWHQTLTVTSVMVKSIFKRKQAVNYAFI